MPGIYIHMPFCTRKCFYCDFYSVTNLGLVEKYVNALCKEIELSSRSLEDEKLYAETVFIGGGTPSLLTPQQMKQIFASLLKNFNISSGAEITVECNPGTKISEYLSEYRQIGINRLSIGVQSFVDEELEFLQRIHDSGTAYETIISAMNKGFDNINADIIFAIPGQTPDSLGRTLSAVNELGIQHISAYSLIYEEGTPLFGEFKKGRIHKTDEALDADLYMQIIDSLSAMGMVQYEVSNFAVPGKKCIHNLNYWYGAEYIAFGPSAHGYMDGTRYWNYRSLEKYFESLEKGILPLEERETLSIDDRMSETIFLELRSQGLRLREFRKKFGFDFAKKLYPLLILFEEAGLLVMAGDTIALTPKGYSIGDEICLKILQEIERFGPLKS